MGTITPHPNGIARQLKGLLTQSHYSGISGEYDSLAHALHSLNMWDFIFNTAEVQAYQNADIRLRANLLHFSS